MKRARKLKIVHVSTAHKPFDTRIFHKQCVSLAEHGYDVALVVAHGRREVVRGVTIVPIPVETRRLFRMSVMGFRAIQAALHIRPDLLHIHDPELLLWSIMPRLLGKRVLFDMHENTPKAITNKEWLPAFARKPLSILYRRLEHALMAGLPIIFAENSYPKDYPWVRKYKIVLNMPISDKLISIRKEKHLNPTAAYLGDISEDRGSLITLQALGMLKQKGLSVRWECIGSGDARDMTALAQRLKSLCLEEEVHLHGYVPPQDAWDIVAKCHLGFALLNPSPNYIESYPTKLFEYMALGLPVIASDFPLYRDIVDKECCGLCVNPYNVHEVADAIERLIKDPQLAKKMGENGRRAVRERYNWDSEREKLVGFYCDILTDAYR